MPSRYIGEFADRGVGADEGGSQPHGDLLREFRSVGIPAQGCIGVGEPEECPPREIATLWGEFGEVLPERGREVVPREHLDAADVATVQSGATRCRALAELRNRGVEDVMIVCCDGLKGLPEAINNAWPLADVQQCVVHLVRNSLKYSSRKYWGQITKELKEIYTIHRERRRNTIRRFR